MNRVHVRVQTYCSIEREFPSRPVHAGAGKAWEWTPMSVVHDLVLRVGVKREITHDYINARVVQNGQDNLAPFIYISLIDTC